MIFTPKNTRGKKVTVFDYKGTMITHVVKYNTKTREAEILLIGLDRNDDTKAIVVKNDNKNGYSVSPVKIKIKLPGSYIQVDNTTY